MVKMNRKKLFNKLYESLDEEQIKHLCFWFHSRPYNIKVIKMEVDQNTKLSKDMLLNMFL